MGPQDNNRARSRAPGSWPYCLYCVDCRPRSKCVRLQHAPATAAPKRNLPWHGAKALISYQGTVSTSGDMHEPHRQNEKTKWANYVGQCQLILRIQSYGPWGHDKGLWGAKTCDYDSRSANRCSTGTPARPMTQNLIKCCQRAPLFGSFSGWPMLGVC